ncbi:DHHA1 domain-containing protein [Massilia sp. Root335]|uniref:DHHA1 domain-containing protein n=1 Tax=Massilia sp. Root335 TaxID=1736517 RepID=UPI0006F4D35D|nr:DHHA1 domain-containing protein [Massilia sp. Root335]KQV40216.1 hypothetical protein ASC93_19525 [Massilia sp. Root335]
MTARRLDVFNGDADGICAQHQWRLAYPGESMLVTGIKRDVALLQRVACDAGDEVTVLDIAVDANAASLRRVLDAGAHVTWFDHHSARQAFAHPRLRLFWDDAPTVCTSLLVDRQLVGRYRPWAIAAAFGDNLAGPARALASDMGLSEARIAALAELGTVLNYNAYGECVEDLHMAPDALYRALSPYVDPFEFIEASDRYRMLVEGYRDDAARMSGLQPQWQWQYGAVYVLPDACWARRISGVFANRLAAAGGARAFAVLTEGSDGRFVVSVRSGAPGTHAANVLCEHFAGGGGRRAAAGINGLPAADIDRFVRAFSDYFAACGGLAHAG